MQDPVLLALNTAAEEHTPEMIESIIAYLRKHRKDYQAGAKPKKADAVDISAILGEIKPKLTLVEPGKRRF